MTEGQIRITDGYERTVDILPCNDGTFQAIMCEASSDYHQKLQIFLQIIESCLVSYMR